MKMFNKLSARKPTFTPLSLFCKTAQRNLCTLAQLHPVYTDFVQVSSSNANGLSVTGRGRNKRLKDDGKYARVKHYIKIWPVKLRWDRQERKKNKKTTPVLLLKGTSATVNLTDLDKPRCAHNSGKGSFTECTQSYSVRLPTMNGDVTEKHIAGGKAHSDFSEGT